YQPDHGAGHLAGEHLDESERGSLEPKGSEWSREWQRLLAPATLSQTQPQPCTTFFSGEKWLE
ncbi:hypothetical protein QWA_17760, partial [Alcaligenes faecalis subsp. faecalis NCIB 8687]